MEIEVQTQGIAMEPAWSALLEERLDKLAARYAELVRVHVTLRHGRHHVQGVEEVDVVATVPRRTLRAAKRRATMGSALRAALDALEHELARYHARLTRDVPVATARGAPPPPPGRAPRRRSSR
jgi:ribosomal subunit interface protein